MMALQEAPEHLTIRLESIIPEVRAHQPARRAQLLLDERQRHLGRGRIREFGQRDRLGTLERLIDGNRQPWMLFHERAADAERVHDRKQVRALVPIGGSRLRVREEVAHIGISAIEAGRRAWPDHRVEFAARQETGDSGIWMRILDADIRGQVEADLLDPASMLVAATYPGDV